MAGDAELRRLLSRFRFDQAANGATTAALVVELGKLYLTGQMTRDEFSLGLVAAEKLGFESAGRIAASHLRSVRALSRADGVIDRARFEPGPAAVRAQATLEALDRLDEPGARSRAVETHAVWADRAAKGGGRRTVERSAAASKRRWRRVPDADPCTFCAMLATRGYLDGGYLSEETALWTKTGKTYHDFCGCVATEIVEAWVPNEQEQRWIDAYEEAASDATSRGLPRTPETVLPGMRAALDAAPSSDDPELPTLKAAENGAEAVTRTNPLWRSVRGYQFNCTNCVVAQELRRRGLDVTAAPLFTGGRRVEDAAKAWRAPDGNPPKITTLTGSGKADLERLAAELPEGARGMIRATWKGGGGHVWSWEVSGGTMKLLDPQSGQPDAWSHLDDVRAGTVKMYRVDDAKFVGQPGEWVEVKPDES